MSDSGVDNAPASTSSDLGETDDVVLSAWTDTRLRALRDAVAYWEDFDVESRVRQLEDHAVDIARMRKEGTSTRDRYITSVKSLHADNAGGETVPKSAITEVLQQASQALTLLTRRAKAAEDMSLGLLSSLHGASSPAPFLKQLLAAAETGGADPSTAAAARNASHLRNQLTDANDSIARLEARLREVSDARTTAQAAADAASAAAKDAAVLAAALAERDASLSSLAAEVAARESELATLADDAAALRRAQPPQAFIAAAAAAVAALAAAATVGSAPAAAACGGGGSGGTSTTTTTRGAAPLSFLRRFVARAGALPSAAGAPPAPGGSSSGLVYSPTYTHGLSSPTTLAHRAADGDVADAAAALIAFASALRGGGVGGCGGALRVDGHRVIDTTSGWSVAIDGSLVSAVADVATARGALATTQAELDAAHAHHQRLTAALARSEAACRRLEDELRAVADPGVGGLAVKGGGAVGSLPPPPRRARVAPAGADASSSDDGGGYKLRTDHLTARLAVQLQTLDKKAAEQAQLIAALEDADRDAAAAGLAATRAVVGAAATAAGGAQLLAAVAACAGGEGVGSDLPRLYQVLADAFGPSTDHQHGNSNNNHNGIRGNDLGDGNHGDGGDSDDPTDGDHTGGAARVRPAIPRDHALGLLRVALAQRDFFRRRAADAAINAAAGTPAIEADAARAARSDARAGPAIRGGRGPPPAAVAAVTVTQRGSHTEIRGLAPQSQADRARARAAAAAVFAPYGAAAPVLAAVDGAALYLVGLHLLVFLSFHRITAPARMQHLTDNVIVADASHVPLLAQPHILPAVAGAGIDVSAPHVASLVSAATP